MTFYQRWRACKNKPHGCTSQAQYIVRANFVRQCSEPLLTKYEPDYCFACAQVAAERSTQNGQAAGTYTRQQQEADDA
jgi:hypothetical protein